MGALKTYRIPYFVALCLFVVFQTLPVRANFSPDFSTFDVTPDQQLRQFAICAGRLSAITEHERLFEGGASEAMTAQRSAMLELVDAIMPPDQGREVLSWRVNAKAAQAALLSRATFSFDATEAQWAQTISDRLLAECTGFLLN
ncbi:hypothetical protein [Aestuariibius sp. HNIBRBA575]|uniref:hypothetical protein n=1 Tax=Aestuariibius sp. HNIBRBA575 TaxID=3233343 RepID=UPI0034A3BBE7